MIGDRVKVTTDETIEGTLIKNDDLVIVKLDSGYNLVIKKDKIKNIKSIENKKENKQKKENIKQNKKLPTISILHTGGTIASKVDYSTGAVSSKFEPEELISMFPELHEIANLNSRLIGNMWSQDMRFSDYNLIAKEIEKEIKKGVDGIIVTQGTDTLHYTSAALAFILENINIPVLVVGSQRSSDRGSSDAGLNLINAAYFIANSNFADVGVCMHNSTNDDFCAILPATNIRKMHTSRRDAFKSINSKNFALVDFKGEKIKKLNEKYNIDKKRKLSLKLLNEKIKVGILRQYTNMYAEDFSYFKNHDGLVIESTGLGNLPISGKGESNKIFKTLEKMKNVIVLSPQTIFGRLNLNVYENARKQQEIGILGHQNNMTTETTFIKLAWLLSNHKKDTRNLILKDLRGELSERTEFEEEYL